MRERCGTCGLASGESCPWCAASEDRQAEHAWPIVAAPSWFARLRSWLGRVARTGNALRKDRRVPWPIRWALCISPFMLAIPGPLDEAMVAVCLAVLVIFWRPLLVEAWRSTL